MAARLSVLYVLFEGLPETVIDSQVGEHIRLVREQLQWEFEICAVACNAPSHAGALRRKQAVEAHTGCRVRVLRGMRPALPGSRLVNGHRVAQAIGQSHVSFDLIHARTDYSAATLGPVARRLGLPMIWDCRGDSVAEFQARSAPRGGLGRHLRDWRSAKLQEERRTAGHYASAALFVSEPLADLCAPALGPKPRAVIPCVASPRRFFFDPELRRATRRALSLRDEVRVLVYSGSLAAYQCFAETVELFETVHANDPSTHLLVVTPQERQADAILKRLPQGSYTSVSADFGDVNGYLNAADLAFMLREDTPVNRVASPTKFAEYCLAGLPVIMTDAVIDSARTADELGNRVGPTPPAVLSASSTGRADLAKRAVDLLSRSRFLETYQSICRDALG